MTDETDKTLKMLIGSAIVLIPIIIVAAIAACISIPLFLLSNLLSSSGNLRRK